MDATIDISYSLQARAYVAKPKIEPPWPGVVVLHEAFGLTDDIRAHADRFAENGFLSVAPDLFSLGPTFRCVVRAFRAMFAGKGEALDAIAGTREWLVSQDECSGKVGVVGFCMGGGFALLCAPTGSYEASVVNYGLVPKDATKVLSGACPLAASYGARDRGSRGAPERLEAALEELGIEHDVKVYPDASHSFLNRHSGWHATVDRVLGYGYEESAAEDAWERTLDFFGRHLKSSETPGAETPDSESPDSEAPDSEAPDPGESEGP